MVQPYNYAIQAPSAFEQLVSGLKLGASMQEMQAAAEQRRMQMDQMQAQQRAQQQQQQRMNELLGSWRAGTANRADLIELSNLSSGEAQKRGIWSQVERMDQEAVRSTIGRTLEGASALLKNPQIGIQILDEEIRANPNDPMLKRLRQLADVDPKEAAYHRAMALNAMGPEGQKAFEAYVSAMPEAAKTQDTAPKPERVSLGDRVVIIDQNPNSPTFNQELRSIPMGAGPW